MKTLRITFNNGATRDLEVENVWPDKTGTGTWTWEKADGFPFIALETNIQSVEVMDKAEAVDEYPPIYEVEKFLYLLAGSEPLHISNGKQIKVRIRKDMLVEILQRKFVKDLDYTGWLYLVCQDLSDPDSRVIKLTEGRAAIAQRGEHEFAYWAKENEIQFPRNFDEGEIAWVITESPYWLLNDKGEVIEKLRNDRPVQVFIDKAVYNTTAKFVGWDYYIHLVNKDGVADTSKTYKVVEMNLRSGH